MTINCYIVDDEEHAIDVLTHYIAKVPFLQVVGVSTDPVAALAEIKQQMVQLLFLDVQMPQLTGIEFLKILDRDIRVILSTAYADYALEGYEYEVVDYLLKPISFGRFLKAVNKMVETPEKELLSSSGGSPYIFVKADERGKLLKVDTREIVFIESMKNYIILHNKQQFTTTVSLTLKEMESYLDKNDFIRVHKSFIVAVSYISSINGQQIKLRHYEDRIIPIGSVFREIFQQWVNKKMLSR